MIVKTRAENNISVAWGLLVRIVLIAAAAYILYRLRSVMIAVILAIMLAYAVLPMVEFLCRWRVRGINIRTQRLVATILVFVLFLSAFAVTLRLFVTPFEYELVKLKDNLGATLANAEAKFNQASVWYDKFYKGLPLDVQEFIRDSQSKHVSKITSAIERFVGKVIASTLSWLTHVVDIVLIPVLAFYFVLDYRSLRREFLALVPKKRVREALYILRDTGQIMQSYVVGQFILCLIAAVLTGIMLSVLGIDYALVLAVFAGITRAIPVIGPVASGLPITILGAMYSINTALILLGFTTFMHFAESKFIMPKLIGHRMKLHPAVVMIVLLIGAEFFGILGMFLAAPIAAVIRELIRFYLLHTRDIKIRPAKNRPQELTSTYLRSERF